MKPYDTKAIERNLEKSREKQAERASKSPMMSRRDRDDLLIENHAINLVNDQHAFISHGQGVRFSQEDKADIFVLKNFSEKDQQNIPKFLYDLCVQLQLKIQEQPHQHHFYTPGSTLNLSLQYKGKIVTANIGDSRAILLSRKNKNKFSVQALNWDHKPTDPDERVRIENEGGYVSLSSRLNGSLALSRALGDCEHENRGISHEPDITIVDVDLEAENYLINCCDGVVDVMNENDIAEFFNENDLSENPANQLRREAYLRGSMDNITVCFTPVLKSTDFPVVSYVADGHGGKEVSNFLYLNLKKSI